VLDTTISKQTQITLIRHAPTKLVDTFTRALQGISLYNLYLPIVKQIPLKEKNIAKSYEQFIDYSIIEHINVFT